MKVIVLADASNRGKSSSIKGVAKVFVNKPTCRVVDRTPISTIDENMIIKTEQGDLIAFCSGGDDFETVGSNIKYAQENNCNILVSASRSKGRTFNIISDFMQLNAKLR